MYSEIIAIIAPVFFTAFIGFFWSFYKLPFNSEFISKFVMNIAAPCLIVATLSSATISQQQLWFLSGITLLSLFSFSVFYWVLLKLLKQPRSAYFNALVFGNTGNMGAPICLFAFGEQGLTLGLIVFMVTSMLHFSLGVSMVSANAPLKTLLKAPVFYAALLAFYLLLTGLQLPKAISNSLSLVGDSAIPLMLLSLGASLHKIRLAGARLALLFAVLRLAIGFGLGVLIVFLFDLTGVMRGVVIIQCTMPSAVFNYLLAHSYKQKSESVAAIVVLSTILSFATLPLLLWYVL